MRIWLWIGGLTALTALAIAMPGESEAGRGYQPDWRPGDSWEVSASYIRTERPGETWSAPETWVYHVAEGDAEPGTPPCLRMEVRAKDDHVQALTEVFLDSETLAVLKVVVRKNGRFDRPLVMEIPEPGVPVPTGPAPTPYDMPAFPLVPGEVREFKYMRKVAEGLFTREVIRQEVKRVDAVDGAGGGLLEVTCTAGDGRVIFVQCWEEGSRWPLYGKNESMEYRLVRP